MNRKQRQIEFDRKHDEYMVDAAAEVEIVKDREGRWDVRVYDGKGYYIGGISSVTDLLVARREAEKYAFTMTYPIG